MKTLFQTQRIRLPKFIRLNLNRLLLPSLFITTLFATSVDANNNMIKTTDKSESSSVAMQKKVSGTRDPNAYADGFTYRHMAGWEESDNINISKIIVDQFEYRNSNKIEDYLRWDTQAWQGTDYEKIWLKFEGEQQSQSSTGDMELQTLYSHSISAFWDLQIGGRLDYSHSTDENSSRYFGVLGLQGLAPYWFEMEPALFVSSKGDISARVVSSYDLLITQKLIIQPRFEINASANDLPEYGIAKGINDVQVDLRLRYEIKREIAPYVGVTWIKKIGKTADYTEQAGEVVSETSVVAGVKIWF
jgi:copper resistance protein B